MFVAIKCALLFCIAVSASASNIGSSDVQYHLFTRTNPSASQPLLPTLNSILVSSFSFSRRTVVTIHSNGEGVGGNFNAFVIPGHLNTEDVNLIAIDWSAGASMYTEGLGNAPQVGQIIADFFNFLIATFAYDPTDIRIVGHGLGGHIAGIAARKTNGNIPHIIAIDPTLHGWTHHPEILNPDDAGVVEVLHASAGSIGYDEPLGDLDFYPNGGSFQTGCGSDSSCAHIYAYAYYSESITSEFVGGSSFVGTACESYEDAINTRCNGDRNVVFGGTRTKSSESGIYTFTTNFVSPFAQG